jgi:hypothetical protein
MKLIIRVSEPAEKPAVEPAEKPAGKPVLGGIRKTRRTYHSSIPKAKADALSRLHDLRDQIFGQTKALTTLRQTVKETENFEKEQELVRDIERLKRLESIAILEFQNMCEVRRR